MENNELKKGKIDIQFFADGAEAGADKATEKPTSKTYTESEKDAEVTKAIKTREMKLKEEFQTQFDELTNKLKAFEEKGLTDAEKVAKQLEEAKSEKQKYLEQTKRLELGVSFSKMGIEEEFYTPLIDDYIKNDFISANKKIAEIINKRANEIAAQKYNKNLENMPTPKNTEPKAMTKAEFDNLSYTQMISALEKEPSLKKFLK